MRVAKDSTPVKGRAEIIPFQYSSVLLGGKGTSHVGFKDEPWVTSHPRGKNYGDRTPPGPCVPHGGTPVALLPPLLSG
jgi:hypothetical protein